MPYCFEIYPDTTYPSQCEWYQTRLSRAEPLIFYTAGRFLDGSAKHHCSRGYLSRVIKRKQAPHSLFSPSSTSRAPTRRSKHDILVQRHPITTSIPLPGQARTRHAPTSTCHGVKSTLPRPVLQHYQQLRNPRVLIGWPQPSPPILDCGFLQAAPDIVRRSPHSRIRALCCLPTHVRILHLLASSVSRR